MPQPHTPSANIKFGLGAIALRPKFGVFIASMNELWAHIDLWLAVILVRTVMRPALQILVETQSKVDKPAERLISQIMVTGARMYLALSGTASKDAVLGEMLGPEDAKRFEPLMKRVKSIRRRRNAVMHGIIGIEPEVADCIVIQDLDDAVAHSMGAPVECSIYKEKDFLDLIGEIKTLLGDLHAFHPGVTPAPDASAAPPPNAAQTQRETPQAHQETSQPKPPEPQA